ncbi:MAG: DNA methyltransferase [Thermodesulfobacteriota bacterium]
MNYSSIIPITNRIPANRQGAKRHYGIHPYFTRRPFNVVRDYILHYSDRGDTVIDPFGGSGVTAIEAFLENRIGVQNDINPLANFIASGIVELTKVAVDDILDNLIIMEKECKEELTKIHQSNGSRIDINKYNVDLPINVKLPSNSDVERYFDLFTSQQLISLAILKNYIGKIGNHSIRQVFLLAWSSTLARINKTFISTRGRVETRGGSSIFSIYRYKVAKDVVELNPWECFYNRFHNILKAKKEMMNSIEIKQKKEKWEGQFKVYKLDVDELRDLYYESADYVFTDPPYGGHISYIDLSILWNSWLGLMPNDEMRQKEIIVGGELKFTEEHYIKRLRDSIKSCFDMLKDGRWLSIVFQHWNVEYFEAILTAAQESNAELKAAVSQIGDPIWSMHKKKGKESVLAGEFILTFYKKMGIKGVKEDRKIDVKGIVGKILQDYKKKTIYGEYLLNQLVIEAWKYGIIKELKIKKEDLIDLLNEHGWVYDSKNHCWCKSNKPHDYLF